MILVALPSCLLFFFLFFHGWTQINDTVSVQWTITELGCYTYSLVAVPLYDTLGTEAIDYIIDRGIKKGTISH